MDYLKMEEQDGIRFSWNVWPNSRAEANKLVIPVAAMYTPLKERVDDGGCPIYPVEYDPLACCREQCRAILNPFCGINFEKKLWTCSFCNYTNVFPPGYSKMSENVIPQVLHKDFTTIEYLLSKPISFVPAFLFVIDTCLEEEELLALKAMLTVVLNTLPANAVIGLITFGRLVYVHEIGYTEMTKMHVFRGDRNYNAKQVQDMLGLQPTLSMNAQSGNKTSIETTRFLLPVSECELAFSSTIERLQRDQRAAEPGKKLLRATGAAISVAISEMEVLLPNSGARIIMFVGGPCTVGPGQVAHADQKVPIRSYHDIDRGTAEFTDAALELYEKYANRASLSGHAFDIFVGCYNQIGIYEMKSLSNKTGGCMVLSDSFRSNVFKGSLQRLFDRVDDDGEILKMGFNASVEVQVTRELKVRGAIGPMISLNKKTPSVSDSEIGVGGTVAWKISGITPHTTVGLYFEISNSPAVASSSSGKIQITTCYMHADGKPRIRVTTVSRPFVGQGHPSIKEGFDQEAAAVLTARIAIFKSDSGHESNTIRWTDQVLIKWCQRVAEYHKDIPSSFALTKECSIYPQLMFHLRRGQLLSLFNSSPDETSINRHYFYKEDTNNSLTMMQPTLTSYAIGRPPIPVLLDSTSLDPNHILLLDSHSHIVIHHGQAVIEKKMYNEKNGISDPEFEEFLMSPKEEAKMLLRDRFPVPRYIVTHHGESQERFLLCKLNPSISYLSEADTGTYGYTGKEQAKQPASAIFTDDVSLQMFIEHLKKLTVIV